MQKLIAFGLGVLKIAVALLVVAIAIIAGVIAWDSHKDSKRVAEELPLATPKVWPSEKIPTLDDLPLLLTTKWSNGRLYYQFAVAGYPKALEAAHTGNRSNSTIGFHMDFYDSGGSKYFIMPFLSTR